MPKNWETLLPPIEDEVCEEHLNEFFRTMMERNEVSVKRIIKKLPAPWTKDSILREYKFSNVYRMLDRCSAYLIQNVIRKETDMKNMLFKIMFYRIFNSPEIIEALGGFPDYYKYDREKFTKKVKELRSRDVKLLNTKAYLINTYFAKGDSAVNYADLMIPSIHDSIDMLEGILLNMHSFKTKNEALDLFIKVLKSVNGIGGFVSHEWYLDFSYMNRFNDKLKFPFTENDYTNVGPGAMTGLRLIFPSMKKQKEGIELLRDLSVERLGELGFRYIHYNKKSEGYYFDNEDWNITLHQIEFWLCEYTKYWKMRMKVGKQRQVFKQISKY